MKKNKVAENVFWMVGIQIVKSVLSMIIVMLTARFLGPSDFGVINYASSIVAFVAPVMYLGLNEVLTQEFVNHPEQEGELLGTSIMLSLISALLCMVGVASFVAIVNRGETETIVVCALYSILLLFQAIEIANYWFQAKLLSKYASMIALFAYILVSAYKVFLLASRKSVYWFSVSNALDYMIIAVGLLSVYKRLGGKKLSFCRQTAKRLWKKSKYYIMANMMVSVCSQTDRIMLKLMIGDEATGYYSVAIACASMASFVFSAIIYSFRPMIFESRQHSEELFEKNLMGLYSIVIYLSLALSAMITLFAGLIVRILYGVAFFPAASMLRVLVWYTTFCYLGSVRNIWILAENKQKYLGIINLSGAILNIVLNYFLIPVMGGTGASLASLITQIFMNVIVGFIIRPIRDNNRLMLRSLNPKYFMSGLKILKRG